MSQHRLFPIFAPSFVLVFLLITGSVQAYTSTDYYNAGLQLYNTQNYPQAAQYFSAAIQMDPNNTAALQGRANCYYAQGQYQQALDDYQRVQALSPNPQLASMIQALQAKVGTGSPAAPPPVPGQTEPSSAAQPPPQPSVPGGDAFAQGTALFQQRQYAQAIPFFQKAVQDNPQNANAYYYLGASQMQVGDMKDAAVALGISNKLSPNASVESYVNQLKSRLSPDDQQWVDGQIQAGGKTPTAQAKIFQKPKRYPRLYLGLASWNLSDFNGNAQSRVNETKLFQQSDPTFQYSGGFPAASFDAGLELDNPLNPDLEIGVMINFMPAGSATDSITNSSGYTLTDSFNILGVDFGVEGRYFFTQSDFQPWIAGGPLLVASNINYSYNRQKTTNGSSVTFGGPFNGIGFGGQVQLGVDYHLGDALVLTLFGGYQLGSASNFQGKLGTTNTPGLTSGSQVQLDVVPTSQGNVIVPVSNGLLCVPTVDSGAGAPAPSGSRPMSLDISGPTGGISVAYYF